MTGCFCIYLNDGDVERTCSQPYCPEYDILLTIPKVTQRRISVLHFFSVVQRQKFFQCGSTPKVLFGNKIFDEQSQQARCIPFRTHNS